LSGATEWMGVMTTFSVMTAWPLWGHAAPLHHMYTSS
jgi:hypothetical protein